MEEFNPHIGKNVIETLTLGMYEDARFIYREYVQNAADQIDVAVEKGILKRKDEGEINININTNTKTIIIQDNATGIESDKVLQFLGDVANSQKDRTKRKGFRGIGRLGGLGYCEKLIFETSYKGEDVKSIITLNAKQLRKIIDDKHDTRDAAKVISVITNLEKEKSDKKNHFFKVKLEAVSNELLLDEKKVRDYLSLVAPIPFNPDFSFQKDIHDYFKESNVKIEEYDVHLNVNDKKLFKPYKEKFFDKKNKEVSKLIDINFLKIRNTEQELIALGWYGVSNLLNFQIPDVNIERGLRLRKDNIGIGSNLTLSRFFKQPRQNLNYIGEVYALSSSFIPNARRDYFNDNETVKIFQKQLRNFLSSLGGLTQDSSTLHNRKKDILKYQEKQKEVLEIVLSDKYTTREKEQSKKELKNLKDAAIKASEEIIRIKQKSGSNENLRIIYDTIVEDLDIEIEEQYLDEKDGQAFKIILSQLNEQEKTIVSEIFSIIELALPLKKAEMLKKKIAVRFN